MQLRSRMALAATAALSLFAAYRFGGGAEARIAPPRAVEGARSPAVGAPNAPEADVVVVHLVDKANEARLTMPNLERGTWALSTHWRKMPVAFHDLTADARKITT